MKNNITNITLTQTTLDQSQVLSSLQLCADYPWASGRVIFNGIQNM